MNYLYRRSFADCGRHHLARSSRPAARERNLFTAASALGDAHRDVCHEVGLLLHRQGDVHTLRERLLELAADALHVVETIDRADGHVGAVLLERIPKAA